MEGRVVVPCMLALLLSACGRGDRVPLPVALNALNRDIIASDIVSPDDVESAEGVRRLENNMRATQRQFCLSNPSVMLLLQDFSLELEGSFGTSTTAGVSNIGPAPSGSVSFGVTTGRTQTLKLPVTVTSLSNMPSVYQQYLFGKLKDVPAPAADKAAILKEVSDLRALVSRVIASFKPDVASQPCKDLDVRKGDPNQAHPYNEVL